MMCDERAFVNNFDQSIEIDDKIFEQKVKDLKQKLLQIVSDEGIRASENDASIYTGISGIALTFYKLGRETEAKELVQKAKNIPQRKDRVTFLCGKSGPLALSAVFYNSNEDLEDLLKIKKYLSSSEMPDELLYGRVGYLYSLLYAQKAFKNHQKLGETIKEVTEMIINSGINNSKRWKSSSPLMYEWHDKQYFGAAHGLVGILFVLLQLDDKYLSPDTLENVVKPSIDYLQKKMFPSGNLPSSRNNDNDKLIHWCHGAPGMIHLLLKAFQVFGSKKYLDSAKKCGQVIWQRGLLKKGYGLCHGMSGNAYGLLALYQVTGEQDYLIQAKHFGTFMLDYGNHGCRNPDRPFSLFEGMSGTIYFLDDLEKNPQGGKFPCFYV